MRAGTRPSMPSITAAAARPAPTIAEPTGTGASEAATAAAAAAAATAPTHQRRRARAAPAVDRIAPAATAPAPTASSAVSPSSAIRVRVLVSVVPSRGTGPAIVRRRPTGRRRGRPHLARRLPDARPTAADQGGGHPGGPPTAIVRRTDRRWRGIR